MPPLPNQSSRRDRARVQRCLHAISPSTRARRPRTGKRRRRFLAPQPLLATVQFQTIPHTRSATAIGPQRSKRYASFLPRPRNDEPSLAEVPAVHSRSAYQSMAASSRAMAPGHFRCARSSSSEFRIALRVFAGELFDFANGAGRIVVDAKRSIVRSVEPRHADSGVMNSSPIARRFKVIEAI